MNTIVKTKAQGGGTGVTLGRRILNLTLFAFFLMYLGCSPYLFYSQFEFSPRKLDMAQCPPSAGDVARETAAIVTAGGVKLSAWFFPVQGARYTAIVHHGQGENIAYKPYYDTAMVLRQAGCSVLLYDYEGFGASEGRPSNEALRRDSEAAYQFLVGSKHLDPKNIVHCGVSLGTGPASDAASRHPSAGLILISPYLRLSKLATHHLPFLRIYPSFLFPQPDLGAEELLAAPQARCMPLLVIHGDNDFLIPVSHSDKLCRSYSGPETYVRVHKGYHVGSFAYEPGTQAEGSSLQICRRFIESLPPVECSKPAL
ncbi:MAG: alpha/beta hydrolase [Cyanobacteria bacterium SZAS LIN-2]|nr:alpha/beta hydrolase [Cyanobacteria bacterium SZAS LIN-2]